ncbi:MAG: 6-carboxytetrahydropterin synthase [Acidobacteriota bacterium]
MSGHRFRLVLEKEDFKFAAAHFTLLGGGQAEPLHGHNYRVRVEIAGSTLDEDGLLVELAPFKAAIRAACASLDDRILLPERSPRLSVRESAGSISVSYEDRAYRFPASEVLRLPLINSSIELLAELLWRRLAPALVGSPARFLSVGVEEAAGQLAIFESALPD